jgi:RsiW-degrading membrane proteinase PrsW (M82 family)
MFLTLVALALAPGIAIGLFIYYKDKHEREPLGLLFLSFLYGVTGTFITLYISEPFEQFLILKDDDVIDQFINAFFKVALIEESCKFLFIRFILYRNKNFNEPFDGIVYSVMVGMGFATFENVIYVFQYGIQTGFLRMFTAVPAHGAFAILMGYFLGKAKFTHHREISYSIIALLIATFFHGLYDYFWFISFEPGLWIGAIVALLIAAVFSRSAIRIHQQSSPFIQSPPEEKKTDSETDLKNDEV